MNLARIATAAVFLVLVSVVRMGDKYPFASKEEEKAFYTGAS